MPDKINTSSNRSFGLVFFIFFFIIGVYPLINDQEVRVWSLIISVFFLLLGSINSRILTPINNLWFKFGVILGKFISPIIMIIIFFTVVTPIGLLMKLLRKDLLNLKFNKNKSYWIEKNGIKSKMKDQF